MSNRSMLYLNSARGAWLLLCLPLVLLPACGNLQARDRVDKLETAMRTYRQALRWGEYEAAAQLISRREEEPAPLDREFLQSIRVTSYEIQKRVLSTENDEAAITADIDFYHSGFQRLERITDHQLWWYDTESGQWFLDSPLPDFEEALLRGD